MGADAYRWGHRYNVVGVRLVVGKGSMIVSDGADHGRRRRASQSAFSRPRLDGLIPMIVDRTDVAIDALARSSSPGQEVDLYPVGRALILGITLDAFFGPRLAARADEIGALLQRPQDFIEAPALEQLPRPWPFSRRAKVRDDRRALDQIVGEEITLRRTDPSAARDDLLGALIADDSLSIDEIHDQAATAIGAGFDTTSAALAWMLVRVGRSPDAWTRLKAEADGVLGLPGSTTRRPILAQRSHLLAQRGPGVAAAAPCGPGRGATGRSGHRAGRVHGSARNARRVVALPRRTRRRDVDRSAALRPRPLRRAHPRATGTRRSGMGAIRHVARTCASGSGSPRWSWP